ncbi:MAG: putative RNA methyltransferase [Candidatus Berkiella sp.]
MPQLICPVCALPLIRHDKSYLCDNRHTYDIARQGYVNLHLVNQKKTAEPGDNKEMVLAREAFLNLHHYAPISEAIVDCLEAKLSGYSMAIADVGCGVGYYLHLLQTALQLCTIDITYYGIDISKEAIKLASKHKQINWLVASGKRLPFPENSLDFVISVFSPIDTKEVYRVLKPSGTVMSVTPAKNHLMELRSQLFETVEEHDDEKTSVKLAEYFEETQSRSVNDHFTLNAESEIENLLKMTPYYWKSTPEKKAAISHLTQLSLTLDVSLRCYKKRSISSQS